MTHPDDAHTAQSLATGWPIPCRTRAEAEAQARRDSHAAPCLANGPGYCSVFVGSEWYATVSGPGARTAVLALLEKSQQKVATKRENGRLRGEN